jgi:hypothetical protein
MSLAQHPLSPPEAVGKVGKPGGQGYFQSFTNAVSLEVKVTKPVSTQ